MAMTEKAKRKRQKGRDKAAVNRCKSCPHCEPDHKYYGPGWVYMGNNGPIAPCPMCNNDGAVARKR